MESKKCRLTLNCDTGRVRCFELVNGEQGQEIAGALNFAKWLWEHELKKCIAADALPLVTVGLRPSEVPPELEAMPADAEIVFRDTCNQYDIITTAEKARRRVQEAIDRLERGVVNIYEAATMLSLNDGGELREYVDMLNDAAQAGHLELADDGKPMRAIDTKARADFLERNGLAVKGYLTAFTVTTPAAVNRCLDRIDTLGAISRLPTPVADPSPVAEPSEPPDPQRRLAALRAMGGDVRKFHGKWEATGIKKLEAQERLEGRARVSEKTIRADLFEAAEAEAQAKRDGTSAAAWHPR